MSSSPGSIVIDSVRDAWAHTKATLVDRFNLGVWLKLAFIAMLGATTGGGGGGSFNVPTPSGDDDGGFKVQALNAARNAVEYVQENIVSLLALIIGLVVLWVVIVLAVVFIRCVFRFIFVDAVRLGARRSIREAWSQHTGQGFSLLLWYLVIGLVPIIFIALAILPIVLSGVGFSSGEEIGAALGVGGIILVVVLVVAAVVITLLIQALTNDLLIPAMYVDGSGVVAGWRAVREAWHGRFWDVVVYFLLKSAMTLGAGLLGLMLIVPVMLAFIPAIISAGLMIGGAAALGLEAQAIALHVGPALAVCAIGFFVTVSYLSQCVFLPLTVFMQSYSMAFVGRMDARLRTI